MLRVTFAGTCGGLGANVTGYIGSDCPRRIPVSCPALDTEGDAARLLVGWANAKAHHGPPRELSTPSTAERELEALLGLESLVMSLMNKT